MIGDDRKRYCGDCKLNVYNLSGMTRNEAENLVMNAEGRLCVKFYRRSDGTILTEDCPVGWQAVKKRISRTAAAFVSLIFGILGGLGLVAMTTKSKDISGGIGRFLPILQPTPPQMTVGMIAMPKKSPTPKPSPTPNRMIMGEIEPQSTPKPKNTPKTESAMEIGKVFVPKK